MALEALLVHPARDRDGLGVIRDRHVLVAERAARLHHVVQRVLAVGLLRVTVQVAADIVELDEIRQRAVLGRLDLAAVLAQLGRDPGHVQPMIERLLVLRREQTIALHDAVLVHLPAALPGTAAHGDVVLLGACEVQKRRAEALRLDEAQVHTQPARELHRDLFRAPAQDTVYGRVAGDRLGGLGAVARTDDDVEIADRLLAPAQASGQLPALDALDAVQMAPEGFRMLRGRLQRQPVRVRGLLGDAAQDVLLRARAEVRHLAHTALLAGFTQLVEAVDAERVVELLGLACAEAPDAHDLGQPARRARAQLVETLTVPVREQRLDILGDALPDVRQLGEVLAFGYEVGEARRILGDRARGVLIRAHAELVAALDIEQVRDLGELPGELVVLHGHDSRTPPCWKRAISVPCHERRRCAASVSGRSAGIERGRDARFAATVNVRATSLGAASPDRVRCPLRTRSE